MNLESWLPFPPLTRRGRSRESLRESGNPCRPSICWSSMTARVDATGDILKRLGVTTARHLCNLGYGRAIQTAIKYAITCDYDVLISLDADGQHDPEQVQALYDFEMEQGFDLLIGSRYVKTHDYSQSPLGRRLGMKLFSALVRAITGQRIHDTTSGLKVIRRRVARTSDTLALHRFSRRGDCLLVAAWLPRRRVSDHGRRTNAGPVHVQPPESHDLPVRDFAPPLTGSGSSGPTRRRSSS